MMWTPEASTKRTWHTLLTTHPACEADAFTAGECGFGRELALPRCSVVGHTVLNEVADTPQPIGPGRWGSERPARLAREMLRDAYGGAPRAVPLLLVSTVCTV